jgi:isoleucyl-tRNA synthetase
MKEILTHGFTVDEKGRKMSKSIGNVVTPDEIVKNIGLDGLRLWVASNDYDSDPVVSDNLINNVAEVYRKIRNTCRGLLLNLYDFNVHTDVLSLRDLLLVDQYALVQLHALNMRVQHAYKNRKTTAVFHELADYCVKDISSLYLDIVKDRLYVEKADGKARRSAQTVCYYILDTLTKLMAPVLSVTAELISDHYQVDKKRSIHLQDFADTAWMMHGLFAYQTVELLEHTSLYACSLEDFDGLWQVMQQIRSLVLKSLEVLRAQGVIKHSLDAAVRLHISSEFKDYERIMQLFDILADQKHDIKQFLKEYFIVSQVELDQNAGSMEQVIPGVFVESSKALGSKCVRCWQWEFDHIFHKEKQLCMRCVHVVA